MNRFDNEGTGTALLAHEIGHVIGGCLTRGAAVAVIAEDGPDGQMVRFLGGPGATFDDPFNPGSPSPTEIAGGPVFTALTDARFAEVPPHLALMAGEAIIEMVATVGVGEHDLEEWRAADIDTREGIVAVRAMALIAIWLNSTGALAELLEEIEREERAAIMFDLDTLREIIGKTAAKIGQMAALPLVDEASCRNMVDTAKEFECVDLRLAFIKLGDAMPNLFAAPATCQGAPKHESSPL